MDLIEELIKEINFFIEERKWEEYHTPKNLAISISIEANELLEKFQWNDIPFSEIIKNKEKIGEIADELADILIYCLIFIDKANLKFLEIIKRKIEKNRKKYPS